MQSPNPDAIHETPCKRIFSQALVRANDCSCPDLKPAPCEAVQVCGNLCFRSMEAGCWGDSPHAPLRPTVTNLPYRNVC